MRAKRSKPFRMRSHGGSVAITLNSTPLAEQVYSRFDAAETQRFFVAVAVVRVQG